MSLRLTLLLLSLLAFLSASIGGYLYYSSVKEAAFKEGERRAAMQVATAQKNISSFLSENIKPAVTLAGMDDIVAAASIPSKSTIKAANHLLDHFQQSLTADVCYLMDSNGLTIASSNRNSPESFTGKNFSFRPYFKNAIQGKPSTYLALGTTSKKRGAYCSSPVFNPSNHEIIGVLVIKASIDRIEKELIVSNDEIILVTDPNGVIFISTKANWLLHLLNDLPIEQKHFIKKSRQFGPGPLLWTGLTESTSNNYRHLIDNSGKDYLMHQAYLENFPEWKVVHLSEIGELTKFFSDHMFKNTGPAILILCLIIGAAVLLLYTKARTEIIHRHNAEDALRASEKRYRSLYNNTPAMLHSIDKEGRILSVSDYWLKVLGYELHEVLGKKLTTFYTEPSRLHAENIVFPAFFKDGFCQDIPYQFIKKDGEKIDILLSAFGERNNNGEIVRSLAVSVDITERKKAEEQLKFAKEELSLYSKGLEQQVEKRTHEIRRISASIIESQEKERAAIARELHDEFGQILTALKLEAESLHERLCKDDYQGSERATRMCKLIDSTIDEVRNMALRIRPGILDDLGLVEALEWLTTDFERRTGISCVFEHKNIPVINDPLATAAYRITQEALTNAARHSHSTNVDIILAADEKEITLSIKDNGVGFETSDITKKEGLGIVGMRERAGLAGGVLHVISSPDNGVEIIFKVLRLQNLPVKDKLT